MSERETDRQMVGGTDGSTEGQMDRQTNGLAYRKEFVKIDQECFIRSAPWFTLMDKQARDSVHTRTHTAHI